MLLRNVLAGGLAAVAILHAVTFASAATRTYSVVQSQSYATASGFVLVPEYEIEAQGLGSLFTHFSGNIVTDRTTSSITFLGGSNIDAVVSGNWAPKKDGVMPGTEPADLGGKIDFGDTGTANIWLAARDLVADLTSVELTISAGQFDRSQITVGFVGNSWLDYNYSIPGFGTDQDRTSMAGPNYSAQFKPGMGTLSAVGLIETLTIPIDVDVPIRLNPDQEPIGTITLTGQLVATATLPFAPGDFDHDGDVDGADFVAWQTNFPKATGATAAQGDADGDNDVDGADFAVWQSQFPQPPAPGVAPVPEPGAAMLFLIGAAAFCGRKILRLK